MSKKKVTINPKVTIKPPTLVESDSDDDVLGIKKKTKIKQTPFLFPKKDDKSNTSKYFDENDEWWDDIK